MGVSRALLSGLAVQRAPLGDRGAAGAFSTGALRVSARAPRPEVSAGDPVPGIGPPVRLPGQAPLGSGPAWFGPTGFGSTRFGPGLPAGRTRCPDVPRRRPQRKPRAPFRARNIQPARHLRTGGPR